MTRRAATEPLAHTDAPSRKDEGKGRGLGKTADSEVPQRVDRDVPRGGGPNRGALLKFVTWVEIRRSPRRVVGIIYK